MHTVHEPLLCIQSLFYSTFVTAKTKQADDSRPFTWQSEMNWSHTEKKVIYTYFYREQNIVHKIFLYNTRIPSKLMSQVLFTLMLFHLNTNKLCYGYGRRPHNFDIFNPLKQKCFADYKDPILACKCWCSASEQTHHNRNCHCPRCSL